MPALPSKWPNVLMVVAFLPGAVGDLLSGHACPHHEVEAGAGTHSNVAAAAHGGHHHGAPNETDESADGARSPACTCIGACHVGAATPITFPALPHGPSLSPLARAAAPLETAHPTLRSPLPYLLHQPNAPPSAS